MSNHIKEQQFRELLKKEQKTGSIFTPAMVDDFVKSFGLPRFLQISKEEGVDLMGFIERAMQGSAKFMNTLAEEHKKVADLLKTENANEVGELLIAHLRLEYLIDQILLDNMKIFDDENVLSKAKLTFFQKLCLLPGKKGSLSSVLPVLHEINKLRNTYAHNISFKITDFKCIEIDKLIEADKEVYKEEISKFRKILRLVNGIEMILLFETPEFRKRGVKVLRENPEFWEMIEISKKWEQNI